MQNIEECRISSIQNGLIQVLINILNNSRDVLLPIEIKEDIIDKIFEPYFIIKHKFGGTSIGLYMSKEIVEKHLNGRLHITNDIYIFEKEE
ncbi:ATP-binding protein [Poseidonibacter antarcticus]|uniref:ATP-binding protein n=1 Tax=Poseidonibacter antarcticus TaxID=2478538 RepID=UPI000EF54BEA|nr:ATP-binding protein [Poseidonibacter antarcticus]